jgi:hypothetical protein
MKRLRILLTGALFLLASCKPPVSSEITATDTGKIEPGAQTIKGGNVTFSLSNNGKPVS